MNAALFSPLSGCFWKQHALRPTGILGLALLLFAAAQPFALPAAAEQGQFQTERCFAVANEPGPTDIFFEIDLVTGISTEIGPLNGTSEVEAIAFMPTAVDPLLYAANAGQFGLIELNTGASGTSVKFNPIGNGFGNGDGTDGEHFFDDVDGMAYDLATGNMYGVQRRTNGETDLLFIIDVTTGRLVRDVFFIDGELRDYAEVESINGLHDVDDIAVDPRSGRMFGVINSDGRSGILVEINPATGDVPQSYPTTDRSGQIVDDIEGLAFAGNGVLYGSTGENGPDNGDANRLFSIGVDLSINQAIAEEVGQFPDDLEDVEALGCLTSLAPPPAIDIEKATNGDDADTPTGPMLPVGSTVTWTYVVQNTGEADLENVVVTDDKLPPGAVSCPQNTLAVGASMTCTATGTAAEGQYANVGTVTASAVDTGEAVSDSDPSHYIGMAPAIDIEKATNGDDADTPTGPVLPVGNSVTWTYVVQNTGDVDLTNVVVRDDQLPAGMVSCPKNTLAIGESMTCTASGTAEEGQYANIGTVTAKAVDTNTSVSDSDPSHYLGVAPAIDIEKATNGVDADTPTEAPSIITGAPVEWTYVVQNTGPIALADVTIDDDILGPISCAEGAIPTLAPGDSFTCTTTGTAQDGDYANIGTTTGTPVDASGKPFVDDNGTPIAKPTDSDPSHYVGISPSIDLEKRTNGVDADDPPGVEIVVGEPVTWTYIVTNTGDTELADVSVYDDQIDEIDCPQTTLAVGESMICTATGIAEEGPYVNMGTTRGRPPFSPYHVTHEDPSHYIGILPSIDITKTVEVAWSYVISNTGEEAFEQLSVDGGPDVTVTCPQTTLAVGESITCPATGPRERYDNDAVVTAFAVDSGVQVQITVPAVPLRTLALSLHANQLEPVLPNPPQIAAESTIEWTLHITNSSTTAVTDVEAMLFTLPSGGTPATCPQGTLNAGQAMICTASSPAKNGVQWVVGSATARTANTGSIVAQNTPGRYQGIAPATVGGNVFIDRLERNGLDISPNGIQDAGEVSFTHPGLNVELYRFDDTLVDSTGIAADGTYQFQDLEPGDYYMLFMRPAADDAVIGFPWTSGDAGSESVDSDARPAWHPDENTARTNFFRLESGQRDMRWDFGIAQGYLEGLVWFDNNVNGTREPSEAGAEGIVVQLIDSNGNVVATTTTDADGIYSFGAVDPGEYSLNFVLPPGYTSGPSGTQPTINLGIYPFTGTIFMPFISR